MTAVMSFCAICLLLVTGKIIRSVFPVFQKLYLPASVIGGVVGLLVINLFGAYLSAEWFSAFVKIPSFLINIVFAGLFLGSAQTALKKIWHLTASQFCFGQIIAWGQYVVGLGLTLFLLSPLFGIPNAFGNLLEIGFEGGHGTVGGLAPIFQEYGWTEGADLGYTIATSGMIFGIIIGIIIINIGVRKGLVSRIRTFSDKDKFEQLGIYRQNQQPSAGKQTTSSDSINSLALHTAMIGIAIFIGYGIKTLLTLGENAVLGEIAGFKIMQGLPLFPLCMIGGLLLQWFLRKKRIDFLIDHNQIQLLIGAALDFLIVAGIASIRFEFIIAYWIPLFILILGGLIWNTFTVLYIGPRIFDEAWFERSIAEFGQSSGVTATGLMLLHTVDPENETIATEAFGYKQLLHEPIMGGGLWTSLALPLVMYGKGMMVWLIALAALVISLICWRVYFFKKKNTP